MFGPGERLIPLDVEINIRSDVVRDFMDALGAAAMVRRSHPGVPSVFLADVHDVLRVGGDNHFREKRRGGNATINLAHHGEAGEIPKRFAWQAGGGKPRRNHRDCFHKSK